MPLNYTYPVLVQEILDYLERSDEETAAQVPNFIMLGTRRIAKECKTLGLKNYIYGNLTAGIWIYAKPGNWRSTCTITLMDTKPPNSVNNPTFGQKFPLKIVSFSYCELYAPSVTTMEKPLYYSDYDYFHWYISPTPDFAYPISVGNYVNDIQLDMQLQQNFLIQQAPELLLYASLLEAQVYIKSPPEIKAVWKAAYDDVLGKFNAEDTLRMFDSYSNRNTE